MMFDRLRSKEAATVSAVLALGLGVTACGGGSGSTEGEAQINTPSVAPTSAVPETSLPGSGVTMSAQYFNDGTREIEFDKKDGDGNDMYADILDFCDGPDLVEETAGNNLANGGAGNSITRSVDYPGCADGKLTPSDFRLNPAK